MVRYNIHRRALGAEERYRPGAAVTAPCRRQNLNLTSGDCADEPFALIFAMGLATLLLLASPAGVDESPPR